MTGKKSHGLCRIGLHAWKYNSPRESPTGDRPDSIVTINSYRRCQRCGIRQVQTIVGYGIYTSKTPWREDKS